MALCLESGITKKWLTEGTNYQLQNIIETFQFDECAYAAKYEKQDQFHNYFKPYAMM
jgi:hypothetical protein